MSQADGGEADAGFVGDRAHAQAFDRVLAHEQVDRGEDRLARDDRTLSFRLRSAAFTRHAECSPDHRAWSTSRRSAYDRRLPSTVPQRSRRLVLGVLIGIVVFGCAACALTAFVFGLTKTRIEAFEAQGPSMIPYIQDGDRVLVDKSPFGLWPPGAHRAERTWGAPSLGDVVVAYSPEDDVVIIKRVVGVAGDEIAFRDGRLVRNGVEVPTTAVGTLTQDGDTYRCVSESFGTTPYTVLTGTFQSPPLRVPAGNVFLVGDHRQRSNDSRYFGSVPVELVMGRVTGHYYRATPRLECVP